ncbi:unnamed protein product [Albugo candida]|uniref:Apple domain-containing protein n=1 Tax=Albugo candida TaxID=65357 RepID=A0A024FTM3_9STRA|nr:unnamed protein product [Albugo candida]|eukprot:CCI10287.1 unnamed protein product [Albugo candida]
MIHPYWLFLSVVCLRNKVTNAKDPVIITATFSTDSNLGECQFCLTNIAGVNRISLLSITTHYSNPPSATAILEAFGLVSSFLRAGIECQGKSKCGSITMTGLEHVNIKPSLETAKKPRCVLTDVQTTFECGVCLQMASGSHMIEKFLLVTDDETKHYFHVLYTTQSNIFEPCSFSGICSGVSYEFADNTCVNLVNKLNQFHFRSVQVAPSSEPKPNLAKMHVAIKAVYDTTLSPSSCFKSSAILDRQTECLGCIALYSNGMAVLLVSHTTAAQGHDKEKTEQLVFLISERTQRFIPICEGPCGLIAFEAKSICVKAYKTSISHSTTVGKIYYNMPARNLRYNQIAQNKLAPAQPSDCMWVEHELNHGKNCQTCLKYKAGFYVKRLSHIDFLISSKYSLPKYSISECITASLLESEKFCKKVISVPNQLCNFYNLPTPELGGTSNPGSSQKIAVRMITIVIPGNRDPECFICLTSWFDILITDLNYFLTASVPELPNCFTECGNLRMNQWQPLDVSMIPPMSSNSITTRFGIMENQSLPYENILSDPSLLN